jgi:hypothetical protein
MEAAVLTDAVREMVLLAADVEHGHAPKALS